MGLQHSVRRALGIAVAGSALGLIANAVSPRGIPYITPPKAQLHSQDIISLQDAEALWGSGTGMFLDARAPADYAAGHIANAFNLPDKDFDEHFSQVAAMLTQETPIVVYCDGEQCELSHHVMRKLRERGYTNVRVLVNGWTVWRNAGLATQTGQQP